MKISSKLAGSLSSIICWPKILWLLLTGPRDGDLALFTSLLNSADVNHVSESLHGIKYTPLGISIVFNHPEIALRLLDHPDIDVNKKTCESTALHYAALRNNVDLIEAICAKEGAQVNQKDFLNDGVTPLAVAVRSKHADAVRQLVRHQDTDLDPLDNDGHSLEFLVRRVENSRNAEIMYIIEQAREARMATSAESGGGLLAWLGLPWIGDAARREEEEREAKRRRELHEKELFELQALKEEEEAQKRRAMEKSINSLLDSVERKREELVNKENVLRELELIQARERQELEEEFQQRQRQLEQTQNCDAERITEEREKLCEELTGLESQLEELVCRGRREEEQALPCPECPVCLELLLPPTRIMQCTNGHLVCEACEAKPELACCPTCRQEFTGRATAMEQHLSTLFT